MLARRAMTSWLILSGLGLIFGGSGCAMVDTSGGESIGIDNAELPQQPNAVPAAFYTLEVRTEGKTPETKQMTLDGATFVQTALVKTGLTKKFRRMDLILRRASNGESHKLDIKYDHSQKMVDPLYDYALHPGDHLIVIEDTSTILDDMVESVSKPLGLSTASSKGR